jgi:hypothetical protein
MRRAVAVGIWSLALIGLAEAQALRGERREAANHIAQAMAVAVECSDYEPDEMVMTLILARYKLKGLTEYPLLSDFQSMMDGHLAGLKAAGNTVGCLVGWGLYGPGGRNVPGLLRRK